MDALPFPASPVARGPGSGSPPPAAGTGSDGPACRVGLRATPGCAPSTSSTTCRAVLVEPHHRSHVRRPDPAADVLAGGRAHRVRRHGVAPRPDHRGGGARASPVPAEPEVPDLPALPEPAATKTLHAPRSPSPTCESTLLPLPPTTVVGRHRAPTRARLRRRAAVEAAPGLTYVAVARVPAPRRSSTTEAGTAGAGRRLEPACRRPASLAPYLKLSRRARVRSSRSPTRSWPAPRGPPPRPPPWPGGSTAGRFRYTLSPPAAQRAPTRWSRSSSPPGPGSASSSPPPTACWPGSTACPPGWRSGSPRATSSATAATASRGPTPTYGPRSISGPPAGWTSYEPTPASSGEATGVGVNNGSRATSPRAGDGRRALHPHDGARPAPHAWRQHTALLDDPEGGHTGQARCHLPGGVVDGDLVGRRRCGCGAAHGRHRLGRATAPPRRAGRHDRWRSPWGRPRWWRLVVAPFAALWQRSRRRRVRARGDPTGAVLAQWSGADRSSSAPVWASDRPRPSRNTWRACAPWPAPRWLAPPTVTSARARRLPGRAPARPPTVTGVEAAVECLRRLGGAGHPRQLRRTGRAPPTTPTLPPDWNRPCATASGQASAVSL